MPVTVEETTIENDGPDGKVLMYTLKNSNAMTVKVMTYGATIVSIEVPDKNGVVKDVVLGFDTSRNLSGFRDSKVNPYFGATVGRVANRIKNAEYKEPFESSSPTHKLTPNIAPHHLHGGAKGFTFVNWKLEEKKRDAVIFCHRSEDGDEGYPGTVVATVQYKLDEDNILYVHMEARTDKNTIINMTNHAYFNLAGHDTGREKLYEHYVQINADDYLTVDDMLLPKAKKSVANTPFDLREGENIADRIAELLPAHNGFDHNFCIRKIDNKPKQIALAYHPESGRAMKVISDQPGVQFYTANSMPDMTQQEKYPTKDGCVYEKKHAAFCLESQKWPDAINRNYLYKIKLKPDKLYQHNIAYYFGRINATEDSIINNAFEVIKNFETERITNQATSSSTERAKKRKTTRDGRPYTTKTSNPLKKRFYMQFGEQTNDDICSTISSLQNCSGRARPSNSSLDPSSSSGSSKSTYPLQPSASSKSAYPLQTSDSTSSSKNLPPNTPRKPIPLKHKGPEKSFSASSTSSPKSFMSETSAILVDSNPSSRLSTRFPDKKPAAFQEYTKSSPMRTTNLHTDTQSFWRNLFGCLPKCNCSLRSIYARCRSIFLAFRETIRTRLFCKRYIGSESRTEIDKIETTQQTEQQIMLANPVPKNDIALITVSERLGRLWEYFTYTTRNEKKSEETNEYEMQEITCKFAEETASKQIIAPSNDDDQDQTKTKDRLMQTKVQIHSLPKEAVDSPQRSGSNKHKVLLRLVTQQTIDEITEIDTQDIELPSSTGTTRQAITESGALSKSRPSISAIDEITEFDKENNTPTQSSSTEATRQITAGCGAASNIDNNIRNASIDTTDESTENDAPDIGACSADYYTSKINMNEQLSSTEANRQTISEYGAASNMAINTSISSIEHSDYLNDIEDDTMALGEISTTSETSFNNSTIPLVVEEFEAALAARSRNITTDTLIFEEIPTDIETLRLPDTEPAAVPCAAKSTGAIPKILKNTKKDNP